jgi:glycosyltransferase involved in cell wall biosynthesis
LKIAVNTRFLLKDKLEGIGWFTYEVLQRLVKLRPEDEFIFYFDRPFDESFVFGNNVKAVRLFPPARHPFLWYLWFEWSLPMAMKRDGAEVFLSPDGYCSLSTKVPTIMVAHDIAHHHFPEQVPYWARLYYNYFIPRYLKKADRIITVSQFTKKDIETSYSIDPDKMTVAHNGGRGTFMPLVEKVQDQVRAEFSEGCPYFFYTGAVHPRKNVHRLIAAFDAFKKKQDSNAKLLIGGRFAWQTGVVKTSYEQAEFKKDILFLGYLAEEELTSLMASALALVYVSNFEGFGLPVLEAMHCEVPVITSTVSSLPEVAGDAAILVSPDNTVEIEHALESLWSQPELRSNLIQKGKVRRTQFSWQKTAAIINDTLDQL